MLAEFLYAPTARDVAGVPLRPFFEPSYDQAAAATVTAAVQVPAELYLAVLRFQVTGQGGAAQTVDGLRFEILDPQQNVILSTVARSFPGVVNASLQDSCEFFVPPLHYLQVRGEFSAGVAVNTVLIDVVGWLFPRGNLPSSK